MPLLRLFSFFIVFMCLAAPVRAMDDAILAVVNDEVITVKDLQDYMQGILAQLKVEGRTIQEAQEIMAQYQTKGIEQLVDDRLILSAADTVGLQIRPQAINDRMEDIKKKYSSYQDFLNAIKSEGMTITDIRKKIENQIKGQVMINNEVRGKVYVNPQEVTDYFNKHPDEFSVKDKVFIETIFVRSDFGKDEAEKKINDAMVKIRSGADFKEVAAKYSELPSIGEIAEDQLRLEFKEQLVSMNDGGISNVIAVPNGFFILKLEGRRKGSLPSLTEAKDGIYQQLFESKFRERFKAWIEELRKKAYVEIKS